MTCEEFSNAFDVLLSSYKHKSEFGDQSSLADLVLDEYEKSIFLTQAQDKIVKSYFTRTLNSNGEGFDDSTRRQMDFSNLVTIATFGASDIKSNAIKYSDNGTVFDTSDLKALFIINEKIKTAQGTRVVVPLNYKEYDRQMSKAYSEPLKRQAWRLFGQAKDSSDGNTEIIARSDDGAITEYKIRYVRRPKPIVLVNLSDTANKLEIDGEKTQTECELNPIIHDEILQEAVRLALIHNNIETPDVKAARQANNR